MCRVQVDETDFVAIAEDLDQRVERAGIDETEAVPDATRDDSKDSEAMLGVSFDDTEFRASSDFRDVERDRAHEKQPNVQGNLPAKNDGLPINTSTL